MRKWIISLAIVALAISTITTIAIAQDTETQNKEAKAAAEAKVKKAMIAPIRDKWALVVGVGKFKNKEIPPLQFAAKDAADFYRFLVEKANFRKDHVRILLNEEATERKILSNLCEDFLPNLVQPNDLVVIYFSTHGSPSQVNLRGEGKNYLVAYDSNPKKLLTTGIEMRSMLKTVGGQVNSKRILMVLDACHSGTLDPNAKGLKRVANFDTGAIGQGTGQLVICSSMPDEQSWESKRYKNGVFTKQLLEGLSKHHEKTGVIESFNTVKSKVNQEVKQDRLGAKQTPVLNSKWKGEDLILASRPSISQVVPETVLKQLGSDSSPRLEEYMKHDPEDGNIEFNKILKDPVPDEVAQEESNEPASELVLNRKYFESLLEGDPKTQLKGYTSAIRSNPKDPELFYRRAIIYIHYKKWIKALNDLSDALMNTPTESKYYLARAYVQHKRNDIGNAMMDKKQASIYDRKLPKVIKFGK